MSGPEGVLMDEGVTVNNVDISRLLDNAEGIRKLIVSDPVTFSDPLVVSKKAMFVSFLFLMKVVPFDFNICCKAILLNCIMSNNPVPGI